VFLACAFLGFIGPPAARAADGLIENGCASKVAFTFEEQEQLGITYVCIPKLSTETDLQAIERYFMLDPEPDVTEWGVAVGGTKVVQLAGAVIGTMGPNAGKIVGGVSALTGMAFAGISLAVGGVLDWWWDPDDADLPMVTATAPVAGYAVSNWIGEPPVWDVTTWRISGQLTSQLTDGHFAESSNSGVYCAAANAVQLTAAEMLPYWTTNTLPALYSVVTSPALITGGALAGGGYTNPVVFAGKAVGCPQATTPAFMRGYYSQDGSLAVGEKWVASLGEPITSNPARTIEQTITCQKPDLSTYTLTSVTEAGVMVPGSPVGVAGLMCDVGDRALDMSATVHTPGEADMDVVNPLAEPVFKVGTDPSTDPSCMASPAGCLVPSSPSKVTVGDLADPPPEAEAGSPTSLESVDHCGIGLADLLSGDVMFKAVGCALSWAFVPRPAVTEAALNEGVEAWKTSKVGKLASAGLAVPLGIAAWGTAESDCVGPVITVPLGEFEQEVAFLNSCAEPMKTVAVWVKRMTTIFMVIGGVIFVINPILLGLKLHHMPFSSNDDDGQGRLF